MYTHKEETTKDCEEEKEKPLSIDSITLIWSGFPTALTNASDTPIWKREKFKEPYIGLTLHVCSASSLTALIW